ncbi:MAG: adenylate/guanylate cyclase domain-containing response regulator [Myxococcota bacterium]
MLPPSALPKEHRSALEGESSYEDLPSLPFSIEPERPSTKFSSVIPSESHILVVDDDETTRRTLGRSLSKLGYVVNLAAGGEEALRALGERMYDLVLMDLLMPGITGDQLLERMKAMPDYREVPALMISGLDDLEMVAKCIDLGADDYLLKPPSATLLKARVSSCLARKAAVDQRRLYVSQIEKERSRADDLLRAIFPRNVIQELKATGTVKPRKHERVAVLFFDVVDFTAWCNTANPEQTVVSLQRLFERLEDLSDRYGVEKIKTIGDAFLATSGLLSDAEEPVHACVRAGAAMLEATGACVPGWRGRVGIHVGPVMAGVLGHRQCVFDVWGDTVNTAAKIQEVAEPGEVFLSEAAYLSSREVCLASSVGPVPLKGKGEVTLYRAERFWLDSERRTL